MAEEKIIYEVIIDTTQLTKQAAETRKAIDDLKAKQKELDTSTAEGRVEFERNAATLRSLQTEYRQATKDIDNIAKAVTAETGSIAQNRAELSRLTAEYIKIGKPTKEQTDRIKQLSATLKQQEKAIGDTRRNVGNYASGIREAASQSKVFGASIGTLGNTMSIFAGGPVLAAVAILAKLVDYFSQFETFANPVKSALSGVAASADVLATNVGNVYRGFFSLIKGETKDAAEFFKNSAINILQLSGEMKAAYIEASNLADAQERLEDVNRKLSVLNAQAAKEVDTLIIQAKDRTKVEKDRIDLLDRAAAIETRNFNARLAAAKAEEILSRRLADQSKKNIAEREGLENDAAAATVKRINLEREGALLQEKITNRKNALLQEAEAEQKKRDEDAKKRREKEQADLDKQLAFSIKLAQLREEGLEAEAEKLREQQEQATEDAFNAELDANQLFFDERQILIQEDYAKRIISKQEFDAQIAANEQERLQSELETLEKNGEDTNAIRKKIADDGVQNRLKADEEEAAARKAKLEAEKAFTDSFLSLIAAIGAATGEGAQAAKAVALFQIALDSAKAVSNITVTSSSPLDPTNLLTGGALIPIKIATGIATVLANIARAVSIVNSAPGFYDGGYTGDGDPREESRAIGRKPYIYHKAEYIIDHKTLRKPEVAAFVENVIEPIRSRNPRMNLSGYADGGFAVASVQNAVNNSLQTERLIKAFSSAELKVGVTEINNAQNRVKVIDDLNKF